MSKAKKFCEAVNVNEANLNKRIDSLMKDISSVMDDTDFPIKELSIKQKSKLNEVGTHLERALNALSDMKE